MNKMIATAVLIAMALGTVLATEANASSGGFCRSSGGDTPVCQR